MEPSKRRRPYRDELDAAHRRIAELQRELGTPCEQQPREVPPELRCHLRAGERVLWWAWQSDEQQSGSSARAAEGGARRILWPLVGALLAVLALRGLIRVLFYLVPIAACLALIVVAMRRIARGAESGRRLYALTDRRVLVLGAGQRGQLLEGAELDECEHPRLRIGRDGRGDIIVPLRAGNELVLDAVEEVVAAGRLLAEARVARREREATDREST